VLKGDALSKCDSASWSGASVDPGPGSPDGGLLNSFGFPARLMGGGTGGAIERSKVPLLRGSPAGLAVEVAKRGFPSSAGVAARLGILKDFVPFETGVPGEGESKEVWGKFRAGNGEYIWGSNDFGGDWGDSTVTQGGDLVGSLGGENATMDIGRGFGVLHGVGGALPRGVIEPWPLRSDMFGVELCALFSLGMSSDIRPSVLLSSRARRPAGEACRGEAGAAALFALSMFSKWLRREETGFCCAVREFPASTSATYNGRAIGVFFRWTVHGGRARQPAPGSAL
jgi:hypothetical protein